jgi:hypothetical protein
MKSVWVAIAGVLSVIYILNPTTGIYELLPDNIPFIGNLDEGTAAYVLCSCVEYFRGRVIGLFNANGK